MNFSRFAIKPIALLTVLLSPAILSHSIASADAKRPHKARAPGSEMPIEDMIRASEDPEYKDHQRALAQEELARQKGAAEYALERRRESEAAEFARKQYVEERKKPVVSHRHQDLLIERRERKLYRVEQEKARRQYLAERLEETRRKYETLRGQSERMPAQSK